MTVKDKKAADIVASLGNVGAVFDPTVIISIITTIVKLFQGCNLTPSAAENRAQAPRLLDRRVLRRQIRQHAGSDDDAEDLLAAFLDAGADLTVADVSALYAGQ